MGIKLKQIESEILCRGSGGVKMTSVTTPDHVVDHNWLVGGFHITIDLWVSNWTKLDDKDFVVVVVV